jgi:methyl-accepting chemotaxis protein
VNIAVNQMDQVTQQNAAMVEESSAATHALSQETQQLNAALARFRVADSGSLARHARASSICPNAAEPPIYGLAPPIPRVALR